MFSLVYKSMLGTYYYPSPFFIVKETPKGLLAGIIIVC